MNLRRTVLAIAIGGLSAVVSACASTSVPASIAAEPAAVEPVDAYAAVRPRAADAAGVTELPVEFTGWMRNSYTDHVTMFASLPRTTGGVAFVGDSITDGGRWAEAWPSLTVRNFGIGGDTSWGVLARAQQVVDVRPERIFLLIGTNDMGNYGRRPEEIAGHVSQLLDVWKAALPQTTVFVQAVLPRGPEFNDRIVDLNARLKVIAADKGARFIDIYTPFLSGDRLDPTVTMDDLHLTGQGYVRWRALIDGCVTGQGGCA